MFELIEDEIKGVGILQQCMHGKNPAKEYVIQTIVPYTGPQETVIDDYASEAYIRIAQSVISLRLNKIKTRWNKECPILASGDAVKFGWDCSDCVKNTKMET